LLGVTAGLILLALSFESRVIGSRAHASLALPAASSTLFSILSSSPIEDSSHLARPATARRGACTANGRCAGSSHMPGSVGSKPKRRCSTAAGTHQTVTPRRTGLSGYAGRGAGRRRWSALWPLALSTGHRSRHVRRGTSMRKH
jgi:hypothetical protein